MRRTWASVTVTCLFSTTVSAQLPAGGSIGLPRDPSEPELGTRIPTAVAPPPKGKEPPRSNAAVLLGMADCVQSRRPAYVDGYLRAPDGSPDAKAALHKMNDTMARCLTSPTPFLYQSLYMTNQLWRGALAEAYLRVHPKPLPDAVGTVRPRYEAAWIGDGNDGLVREMAACIVETQPARVDGLLRTSSGSADERAAMVALNAAEGACLRGGVTLHTNALGLRAALAEALFHREFDAAQTAAAQIEKH